MRQADQNPRHPEEDNIVVFTLYMAKRSIQKMLSKARLVFIEIPRALNDTKGPEVIFHAFWEVLQSEV